MSSLETSLITLGCLMAGTFLGMGFQYLLPEHHLSKESQDTVKLGSGMVATMSALVLGLLVSSSKSSFDAVNASMAQSGARIVQLDHCLAGYGPEAAPVRKALRDSVQARVEQIWPGTTGAPGGLRSIESSSAVSDLQARLDELKPDNDRQQAALTQARQVAGEVAQSRLLLIEQQQQGVPRVFLALLVFWLALLFMSFGLFAPRNLTVSAVLFVCATTVSSAIFLILEMSHPLDGIIKVSSAPLVKALEMIGQ